MRLDHPTAAQIPGLRQLWTEAFGDTEDYLDGFFRLAYAPERCLCAGEGETVAAALYWLDMTCGGQKIAYIYAVATRRDFRGRGLCRALMEKTHALLTRRGYAAAVLVPEQAGLVKLYGKMGYRPGCGISRLSCEAGERPAGLRRIGPGEYNALRNAMLPPNAAELGEIAVQFLAIHAEFFAGEGFLLAAVQEGDALRGLELLGDPDAAPGIVAALGCARGSFRVPGNDDPFAMVFPLREDAPVPTHLGFAFD